MGFTLKNNFHHYYKCWDTGYIPIIIKRYFKKINNMTESISHIFLAPFIDSSYTFNFIYKEIFTIL
jgi:hypothetical protein